MFSICLVRHGACLYRWFIGVWTREFWYGAWYWSLGEVYCSCSNLLRCVSFLMIGTMHIRRSLQIAGSRCGFTCSTHTFCRLACTWESCIIWRNYCLCRARVLQLEWLWALKLPAWLRICAYLKKRRALLDPMGRDFYCMMDIVSIFMLEVRSQWCWGRSFFSPP